MLTARSACVLIGSTPSRSNSTNSTLRLAYGSSACSRPITIYQPSSFFQLQLSHLLFLLAPWFAASRRRFLSVLDVPLFHSFDNLHYSHSHYRTRTPPPLLAPHRQPAIYPHGRVDLTTSLSKSAIAAAALFDPPLSCPVTGPSLY